MHLVGRYERVRPLWATTGWDLPLILDRKAATLVPYEGRDNDEWAWQRHLKESEARRRRDIWKELRSELPWRSALRSERRVPAYAAASTLGLAGFGHFPKTLLGLGTTVTAFAQTTLLLDATYANNTVTDSVTGRLCLAQAHGNLDAIYYYVTASAGTPSSIYAEVTTDLGGINRRATTTIRTSGTGDPTLDAAMVGWHKIVPTVYSPVAETQWIILGNTTGTPTSNNITALAALTQATSGAAFLIPDYGGYTATAINNVATSMTVISGLSALVIVFADGAVFGWGVAVIGSTASNTNRKGWRHPGLTEQLKVFGACGTNVATISGYEISADTAAPGTTLASGSQLLASTVIFGSLLSAPYTMAKATPLRHVFTFSGASTTVPQPYSTGTLNGFTDVNEARQFGSGSYYACANGVTNWAGGTPLTNQDDPASVPHMALLVEDQVAVAGGGGGGVIGGLRRRR